VTDPLTRTLPSGGMIACIGLCVLAASDTAPTQAAEALEVEGAYTVVGQTSDDGALEESTTGSVDLYLGWSRGAGRFEAYVEGNSSLKDEGVATRLPRSNADAGTALDPGRSGRFQLSELKYRYAWPSDRSITAGLLDPSAYLDATRINNDENLTPSVQYLVNGGFDSSAISLDDNVMVYSLRLHHRFARRHQSVALESLVWEDNAVPR